VPSSMDDQGSPSAAGREAAAASGATPPRATLGYETRDANTRGVLGFMALLFVVINLVLFASWRLFDYFAVADRSPAPAFPFASERQVPPPPDLQVNGRKDFQKIYAQQQQKLESYAWEDRKAGIVRIPIERAMDLLLEKGLPVVPSGAEGQSTAGNSPPANRTSGANAPSAALDERTRGDAQ
jgi:hypothetical protein